MSMNLVVYLFLIVAGSQQPTVMNVSTFPDIGTCQTAVTMATAAAQASPPKGGGPAPGWQLLCVPANDPKGAPSKN
jgi:hypothetical protein